MWLFIQPHDTLFFRDGRPFDAGSDVWTHTVFPPYPHTVYGMLRALIAHCFLEYPDYGDLLAGIDHEGGKRLLGTKEKTGALSIRGPFLSRRMGDNAHILLSSPADLFVLPKSASDRRDDAYYLMSPREKGEEDDISIFSDISHPFRPLDFATTPQKEALESAEMKPISGMISDGCLLTYFKGATQSNIAAVKRQIRVEPFITEENCPIIARDNNLCAREGHLALPVHTRMQDCLNYEERGLLLKIETRLDDNLRSRIAEYIDVCPIIKLGGEGRVASVNAVSLDFTGNPDELFNRIAETGRFRTVLTSPAYFPRNAFFPDFLDKDLSGEWDMDGQKQRIQLISAVMGRSQAIGSWDMPTGRPRETVNTIPAGSVLFFELTNYDRKKHEKWALNLAKRSFPGTIPGGEEEYVKKGFNTFMIGAWDYVS